MLSQVKAELDKMLEAKDQAMKLYEGIEAERVGFVEKEKEYGDRLNKMGVELEANAASELNLLDDNKALKIRGENANERVAVKKKRAEDERALTEEE